VLHPTYLTALVRGIRRAGYAATLPIANDPIAGLAVPVRRGSRVFACLTLRYPRRAMIEAEAVRHYLLPLQQAARAIAAVAQVLCFRLSARALGEPVRPFGPDTERADSPLEGDGFELLVPRHKSRGFPEHSRHCGVSAGS
jgi:hypothetical protein